MSWFPSANARYGAEFTRKTSGGSRHASTVREFVRLLRLGTPRGRWARFAILTLQPVRFGRISAARIDSLPALGRLVRAFASSV